VNSLIQRGPTTFYLRAILQKRDNLRAVSNKMMYKTTDSQHRKMKKGTYVSASFQILHNSNLLLISVSGMSVPCSRGFSDQ